MTVVSLRSNEPYDVYIGRPRGGKRPDHYGNPFSHVPYSQGFVLVPTREEAVERFESWLKGTTDQDVCQEQRTWIIEHFVELKGKTLGCWCAPLACHGDVLDRLANVQCPHCQRVGYTAWEHWNTSDMEYTCPPVVVPVSQRPTSGICVVPDQSATLVEP